METQISLRSLAVEDISYFPRFSHVFPLSAMGWHVEKLCSCLNFGLCALPSQVDPNLGDYDDRTALHLAASNGHLDTIQCLGSYQSVNLNQSNI